MSDFSEGRLIFSITVGILLGLFLAMLYFGVTNRRRFLDAFAIAVVGLLGIGFDAVINTLGVTPIVFVRGTMISAAAFTFAIVVAVGVGLWRSTRPRQKESHE
jgi:hypothetical protein